MALSPRSANYRHLARIYAKHILSSKPDSKIGALYQSDSLGKDYLIGLKDVLGPDHAGMIVKEASYETSEPTIDSQVISLQGSGADVFVIAATPKFAAQAIRKSYDLGWNAVRYVSIVSVSVATVLKPAGLEKSKGLITAYYGKDPTDARWKDDAGMKEWQAFCAKYMTATDFIDANATYAFGAAGTMVQVLSQCGNDLSRDNVMKQAANIKDLELPLLLPGMRINTSPTNFSPIRQMQLANFDGASWHPRQPLEFQRYGAFSCLTRHALHTMFTMEYSVSSAREAVSVLFDRPALKPPAVYQGLNYSRALCGVQDILALMRAAVREPTPLENLCDKRRTGRASSISRTWREWVRGRSLTSETGFESSALASTRPRFARMK